MTETSTEISLDALRAGDRTEFAHFVDAYSAPVYRLALRMLGDQQDAEDVLQTTFIKAFQHVESFEGRSSLATWLYRIAANEALMLLRRRKPSISLDEEPEDDEGGSLQPVQLLDWSDQPESSLLSAETKEQLERAIESLPPRMRAVFLMRDIEGLSIKETSEALNLTETAVKTRLLRARLHLREKLSEYFAERLRREKNDET